MKTESNNLARCVLLFTSILIVANMARHSLAQADKGSKKEPVKINGIFESAKAVELKVGTEQTKSLIIEKIVAHGKQVDKDQQVVWFKTDAIDKLIEDGDIELKLAELSLTDAEFKHQQFLTTQEIDRNAAERNWKRAQKDYEHYQNVDRDYQHRSAKIEFESYEQAVENIQDEYDQLTKMYLEDEITEESEQIVLKRTKRQLDDAKFRLEGAKTRYKRTVEETFPRNDIEQKERFQRAEMAYEAALKEFELSLARREQELRKQRAKLAEQKEKLEQLKQERKRFVLHAPIDGMLVHGGLTRGALGERNLLEADKPITSDQVVVTIVPANRLQVRLSVNESELRHLQVGGEVKVVSNLYPNEPLSGEIYSLATIPYSGTKFDCVVKFRPGKLAGKLVPMTGCRVEVANLDPTPTSETPSNDASKKAEPPPTAEADPAKDDSTPSEPPPTQPQTSEEAQPSEAKPAAKDDPITGDWDATVTVAGQEVAKFEMSLKLADDDSVTGSIKANNQTMEISEGKFDRSSSKLVITIPGAPFNPEFTVSGNEMTAEISQQGMTINIRAVKR